MTKLQIPNPKQLLKQIIDKGISQAEVYLSSAKTLKIDVLDQKVEAIDEIQDSGLAIRIINQHKLGFAYTADFDETIIEDTIACAIKNSENTEADENHCFPEKYIGSHENKLELYDQKIAKTPIDEKIACALKMEKAAYQADPRIKKTEKVSYFDSESEVWIINTNGVDINYKLNACGGHASMIAMKEEEMESGFGMSYKKKYQELIPEEIGKEAAQRAIELLGAKTVPSQKIPILLDPLVGTQLLEVLSNLLSSEAVQKGKSLFAGKMGKLIGAKDLTIIDNGLLKDGLASEPFDAEGTPTQETKLIENGILTNYFFNAYTARKGQTRSTGNATRASFKAPPAIGPTNLYFSPGSQNQSSLIKSVKHGLYLTRIMGMHTANPISGDFSLGAAGRVIENGEKTYPVRGITIAGNLLDLLEAIDGIGSDLRFFATLGSPTLLISGLTISGE